MFSGELEGSYPGVGFSPSRRETVAVFDCGGEEGFKCGNFVSTPSRDIS